MSRIKSFKLFESINDIELYIKDVTLELIDNGFKVDIKSSKDPNRDYDYDGDLLGLRNYGHRYFKSKTKSILSISIQKKGTYLTKLNLDENSEDYGKEVIDYTTYKSGSFLSEEVYETFEHIFSYLNTVGEFKSSWIHISNNSAIYHPSKKVPKSKIPDEGITISSEEDFFKFFNETDKYIHNMNINFFIN